MLQSKPLGLRQVSINDAFWEQYQRLVREVVLPYQWEVLNDRVPGAAKSHAVENFRAAAGLSDEEFYGLVFQDSDISKWLEAVAYSLAVHPDPALEKTADGLIDLIGKAQQPDGYLDTYFIVKEPENRFKNLHDCHELYCAGHMLEAAVAYYHTTGKKKFLEIMCRTVDLIDRTFGPEPEKKKGYPGHQELELALLKLYRVTRDPKHLALARYFLSERGREPYYFDTEWEARGKTNFWSSADHEPPHTSAPYNQTHRPPVQQTEAVGHAVRAAYMYTAMADLAGETGDPEFLNAARTLWDNIVNRQMYITGGIGSTNIGEAFTFDYDLPNELNYSETCASIGLIFFAARLLRIEAKGEYADVLERALYNTVLASMSRDGRRFFYVNPLEVWPEACEKNPTRAHVKAVRQPWFACACCPPNVARLLSSLGEYIYTANDDTLFCHLYIGGRAQLSLAGAQVELSCTTDYPWNGRIHYAVESGGGEFAIALRIPGWCAHYTLAVNGESADCEPADGYVTLRRFWKTGDTVELCLDMPVTLMRAHPKVRADAGKVAVTRGPLVYCLEQADNGENLSALSLRAGDTPTAQFDDGFFGGAVVIHGTGRRIGDADFGHALYRPLDADAHGESVPVRAVPYFLWGNRDPGEMITFVRYER